MGCANILRYQFLKVVKEQVDYATQSKQLDLNLEKRIQLVNQSILQEKGGGDRIKKEITSVLAPVYEALESNRTDEVLTLLELKKPDLQQVLTELVLNIELVDAPKKKKRIFDSTTQELNQKP